MLGFYAEQTVEVIGQQRTQTELYDGSLEVRTPLNFLITPHNSHLLHPVFSFSSRIYCGIDLEEHRGLENAFDGRSPKFAEDTAILDLHSHTDSWSSGPNVEYRYIFALPRYRNKEYIRTFKQDSRKDIWLR